MRGLLGLGVSSFLLAGASFGLQAAPSSGSGQTGAAPASIAPAAKPVSGIDAGLMFLRVNQPGKALAAFREVLARDPEDPTANLLAATAALNLYQGDAAVGYAEKARQLVPDDWRVDTTLVTAYAVAGKKTERDAERAKLRAVHGGTKAADAAQANGFLLDMFEVKDYRVEAVEYFRPLGKFHTYYRFVIKNAAGKRVWEYELQSDDLSQKSWAEAHPQEAAAGGRQYSLNSDMGGTQTEYRLFSGDPGYDTVRGVVYRLIDQRTAVFPTESAH